MEAKLARGVSCGEAVDEEDARQAHSLSDSTRQGGYRPDLDGLRALAVFAVVIFHTNSAWLPGGFFGVDIFFVISGYVVSGSVSRHRYEFASDFFVDFYSRRCRRLFPSFILVCSTTAFAVSLLSTWFDAEVDAMLRLGIAATLGNANTWQWFVQDNYFDQRPGMDDENVFAHMWSLGVEEQFYFLFPMLIFAGLGHQLVRSVSWGSRKLLLSGVISALSVASLLTPVFMNHSDIALFYLMPHRFWQLGVGALVWQLCDGPAAVYMKAMLGNCVARTTLEVSTVLVLVRCFTIDGARSLLASRLMLSILPVVATVSFIISGLSQNSVFNASLSHPLIVLLGRMSYTIYLWQTPVLAVFRRRLGETAYFAPVCFVVIALLSGTTFALFEDPARNARLTSNSEALGGSAVAALANVALLRFMIWLRGFAETSCGIALFGIGLVAVLPLLIISRQPRPSRWTAMAVPSMRLPAAILTGVMALHVGSVLFDPTYAEFHPDLSKLQSACRALFRVGSSIKMRDARGLECADGLPQQHAEYSLTSGFQHGCACAIVDKTTPFVPEHAKCGIEGAALPPCYMDLPVDQTTFAVQRGSPAECQVEEGIGEADARRCFARESRDKNAIFLLGDSHARSFKNGLKAAMTKQVLSAMWYAHGNPHEMDMLWPALEDEVKAGDVVWYVVKMFDDSADMYRTDTARLHKLTTAKEAKLVLVYDWPTLIDPGPEGRGRQQAFFCHSHHVLGNNTPCSQSFAHAEQRRKDIVGVLKDMQMKTGVYVFNASKFICPEGFCDHNIPNRHASAYYDYGHLNPFGSRYLAPFICDFAMSHGLK